MRKLLHIEWYKLIRGTAAKVMAAVVIGYAALAVGIYQLMDFLMKEVDMTMPDVSGMPESFHLTGVTAFAASDMYSVLQILMLVLIASLFTSEYSRATLKIMLVGGVSRTRLYLSKFAILSSALFLLSLMGAVTVTLLATAVNGWGDAFAPVQLIQLAGAVVRLTVLNLNYAAILTALAILTRSTGIIIAIGIGVQFAESMAVTLVQLGNSPVLDFLGKLLPSGYAIPFASLTIEPSLALRGLAGSVVIIALLLIVGTRLFRRQDIPV